MPPGSRPARLMWICAVPPARHAFARAGAAGARQLLMFSAPVIAASARILPAFTAYHCGAKPWSEVTNVVGFPFMRSRPSSSVSSASWYADFDVALANGGAPVFRPVPVDVVEVRIRVAVHVRGRVQGHELVAEL